MSTVESEIREMEERLRIAELGPDPLVFQTLIDDDFVLVFDGQICRPKPQIVEAHTPGSGKGQKFDRVEISDSEIISHGDTAVATGIGDYVGPETRFTCKFMRVWAKKTQGWKIVAGSMFTIAPLPA